MERRLPKETDQEQAQKAYKLLINCMIDNPEIEPTLWASAFWSGLVHGYIRSGVSYDEFTRQWDEIKHFYKYLFDK